MDGAEALAEFQRLVTVAVQKGLMVMSDARVSGQPVVVVENIGARKDSICVVLTWGCAVFRVSYEILKHLLKYLKY